MTCFERARQLEYKNIEDVAVSQSTGLTDLAEIAQENLILKMLAGHRYPQLNRQPEHPKKHLFS